MSGYGRCRAAVHSRPGLGSRWMDVRQEEPPLPTTFSVAFGVASSSAFRRLLRVVILKRCFTSQHKFFRGCAILYPSVQVRARAASFVLHDKRQRRPSVAFREGFQWVREALSRKGSNCRGPAAKIMQPPRPDSQPSAPYHRV